MAERKILQMMPAAGWGAAFDTGDEEEITPLVGWALVQGDDGKSAVVGLVAGNEVELCDQLDNFAGYVYLSDLMGDGLELDDDEIEDVLEEEFDDEEDDDDGDINAAPDDGPAYDPTAGLLN
jgi:hypothetical protein